MYKEAAVKMTWDRIGKDAVFVYKRCPVVLLKTAIFHLARMVVSVWVVFLIGINDEHPLIKHTGSIISFQNVTSPTDWLILHRPADTHTHTDQSYGMQFLELRERYKEPLIGQSVQSFRLSPHHTQVRQGFFSARRCEPEENELTLDGAWSAVAVGWRQSFCHVYLLVLLHFQLHNRVDSLLRWFSTKYALMEKYSSQIHWHCRKTCFFFVDSVCCNTKKDLAHVSAWWSL